MVVKKADKKVEVMEIVRVENLVDKMVLRSVVSKVTQKVDS